MNSLAVKAAEKRSQYIVDVLHFGVECNECTYNYEYWAMQDFISQCYSVCETPVITSQTQNLTCSGTTPVEVPAVPCIPAVEILDCNQQYKTIEVQAFELNNHLYNNIVTSENSLRFEFSNVAVNGVNYLNQSTHVDITPDNVEIVQVGSLQYITNIINFLNSLGLPDIVFYPGTTYRTMNVRFPITTTWSITSKHNEDLDDAVHGAVISHTGFSTLQYSVGGIYTAPPYGPASMDAGWQTGVNIISIEDLC